MGPAKCRLLRLFSFAIFLVGGFFLRQSLAQTPAADAEIKGFKEYNERQELFERNRLKGVDAQKKKYEDWEKYRLKLVEEEKKKRKKQETALEDDSPEFNADLKEKQKFEDRLSAAAKDYSAKKKEKPLPTIDAQMQELGLTPPRDRVEVAKRNFNGSKSPPKASFGGGNAFPSGGNNDFAPPPPPPPPPPQPDFFEPDIPPPPPPPPMPEGMGEDVPPPPVFEGDDF